MENDFLILLFMILGAGYLTVCAVVTLLAGLGFTGKVPNLFWVLLERSAAQTVVA